MTAMPRPGAFDAARPTGGALAARPGADVADWQSDTLVDALQRRAAIDPDRVLYTYLEDGETLERSLTASALDDAARAIGRSLAKLAAPGTRVVLLFDDGLDTIKGLFGCLSAGLVAVSGIHPAAPRSQERLLGILRDSQATIVLGQARVLAEAQRGLDEVLDEFDLRWVAIDTIRPLASDPWAGTPAANEGLALIQYTSGSTRDPRGVQLTHRNLLHNLQGQIDAFGYACGDTGVSWLPFSHDMGMIGCVLMAVFGGGRCVLLSPSHFVEDPSRWLRAISRYRATISGGPNFAYDLCARRVDAMDLAALDLSCWTVAVSGAEPVRADVLRRFSAAFAPTGLKPEALRPSYGLAEATLLVTCGDRLAPFKTRRLDRSALQANRVSPLGEPNAETCRSVELVGCGRRLPDQCLAIVDPAALSRVEPGAIGEIWVSGPSVSSGYWERPDDNLAYFAGDLGDQSGPYLRTGDLGFELDGDLFITGRLRDLLVVRGKNYYPQDLEFTAEASHAAVRPGCSACFLQDDGAELVIVSELVRVAPAELPAIAAAVRAAVTHEHGLSPTRIVLVGRGVVPKTPSGKVQRQHTRSALADGQLAVRHDSILRVEPSPRATSALVSTPSSRIEAWLLETMLRLGIDRAALDPTARLTTLGFDSLKIVELKADLERSLGIVISVADLYNHESVQDLVVSLREEACRQEPSGDPPPQPSRAIAGTARPASRLAEQRRIRASRDAAS